MERINVLDRTWQIIGQDLRHVLQPQEISVNEQKQIRQVFRGASLTGESSGKQLLLQMTRHGWLNPMNRLRSDLQQIVYRVEDGVLWRDYRPDRNLIQDDGLYAENLLHQKLIDGVVAVELLFLSATLAKAQGTAVLTGADYSRDWEEVWPPVNENDVTTLPIAVLVRITLGENNEISERLYEIAQ